MSFNTAALLNLRERTTYEAWLLEEVYKITDQRIAVDNADEIIYPPTGAPPTQTIYGVGSINLGLAAWLSKRGCSPNSCNRL